MGTFRSANVVIIVQLPLLLLVTTTDRWYFKLRYIGCYCYSRACELVLPNNVKTMSMKVAATSSDTTDGYIVARHIIEDFRVLSQFLGNSFYVGLVPTCKSLAFVTTVQLTLVITLRLMALAYDTQQLIRCLQLQQRCVNAKINLHLQLLTTLVH